MIYLRYDGIARSAESCQTSPRKCHLHQECCAQHLLTCHPASSLLLEGDFVLPRAAAACIHFQKGQDHVGTDAVVGCALRREDSTSVQKSVCYMLIADGLTAVSRRAGCSGIMNTNWCVALLSWHNTKAELWQSPACCVPCHSASIRTSYVPGPALLIIAISNDGPSVGTFLGRWGMRQQLG